ncbi:ParB/RepB/Spo0J family partition protein [Paraburkholderia phenazinium]|uniref:ParB/RepB/Spo0J family partition protein n=1 Tax=Paraburkholderia phenazinium TaxID=60549 RepID=UPI00158A9523|nr:ParB/RepB/Spo0J family partition protein [Paraburkholderia phenazinium]
MNKPANAFSGLGDVLANGFDDMVSDADVPEVMIDLDEIAIDEQVRTEFEDAENSLTDLGESLKNRQLQAIVVRRIDGPKPFKLVAGERRYRAARAVGLSQLRGKIFEMTDEEAEDAQLAENIHRKNLTLQEEARKIQRDLDKLGSVEAVLEKHNKSRAWLSKILALLDLPEQAKRLVAENISADLEVISTVRQIEKASPKAAQNLVNDLKAGLGTLNQREVSNAVKALVKPAKKSPTEQKAKRGSGKAAQPAADTTDHQTEALNKTTREQIMAFFSIGAKADEDERIDLFRKLALASYNLGEEKGSFDLASIIALVGSSRGEHGG